MLMTVGQAGKSCNGSVNDSTIHTELPRYQYKGVLDVCNKPVALAESIQYFEANDCCSSGALHGASDDLIVKKRTVKYTLPVQKEAAAAVNLANVTSGAACITALAYSAIHSHYIAATSDLSVCMFDEVSSNVWRHFKASNSHDSMLSRDVEYSKHIACAATANFKTVTTVAECYCTALAFNCSSNSADIDVTYENVYDPYCCCCISVTGGAVRAWNHADLFSLEPPQYRPASAALSARVQLLLNALYSATLWSKNDPHPTEAHTDVVTNLLHLPELGLLASTSLDHTIKTDRDMFYKPMLTRAQLIAFRCVRCSPHSTAKTQN
eukprot:7376-Heterococcus_DN1.PRE.5